MDDIATKTLAQLYLEQGHFQKAYEIYKALSERDPSDPEIRKKLLELDKVLNSSQAFGHPLPRSREEKIRFLERWLARIRERKKVL
jgi:tetratricopeptide (TPR) repeat protein